MSAGFDYDLLIHDATLVSAEDVRRGDLAILDGKIAAIGDRIGGSADRDIDGHNLFVLPGYIDAHVHLNEPGRTEWEGFSSGSRALVAGGCTSFLDMPLNSTPVLDAPSFQAKASALRQNSILNGALWGGLVPGHLHTMAELAQCGVVGFKAFMSNSGMDDFPRADRATLKDGMARAANLHLPVAVHAESEEITRRLTAEFQAQGRHDIRAYLDSRPIEAELEAVGEALALASETGCSLHIVHVSSTAALELICGHKQRGLDVTAETCPHYLLLDDEDVLQRGAVAKCAPPLRPQEENERLWIALEEGLLDTIGSDHSPSPPELKQALDFFQVWGGIAGCQHNYPLLFEEAVLKRNISPRVIARLTSLAIAQRFRLPNKGDLQLGWDADLTLLKEVDPYTIKEEDLLTRHRLSAYTGRQTQVRVAMTIAEGRIVYGPDSKALPGSARILRPRPHL